MLLLAEFIVCSSNKPRGIHDDMARESCKVADEVIEILKIYCRWGSSIYRETVDGIHNIMAGIFYNINMYNISNMCTEFS